MTYNKETNNRDSRNEGATDDLCKTANKVGYKARELIDNASDVFADATDKVTTHINEKPLQSSLIALGVGVVLGLLLVR